MHHTLCIIHACAILVPKTKERNLPFYYVKECRQYDLSESRTFVCFRPVRNWATGTVTVGKLLPHREKSSPAEVLAAALLAVLAPTRASFFSSPLPLASVLDAVAKQALIRCIES